MRQHKADLVERGFVGWMIFLMVTMLAGTIYSFRELDRMVKYEKEHGCEIYPRHCESQEEQNCLGHGIIKCEGRP
jgi:hypothetical protein